MLRPRFLFCGPPQLFSAASPPQVLYSALLVSTVLTLIAAAGSDEYWPKRRGLLAVVRVAASFSPIIWAHAKYLFQASPEGQPAQCRQPTREAGWGMPFEPDGNAVLLALCSARACWFGLTA